MNDFEQICEDMDNIAARASELQDLLAQATASPTVRRSRSRR
jgi:hypothetical protein